jgi:hypothetical protein
MIGVFVQVKRIPISVREQILISTMIHKYTYTIVLYIIIVFSTSPVLFMDF